MEPSTVLRLLDLNRQFYQSFGRSFAATRRRIQPGVQRILADLPLAGRWLDLGCGSGALAVRWASSSPGEGHRTGLYLGLDFSPTLLDEARQSLPTRLPEGLEIRFALADLSDPDWPAPLTGQLFDGILAFAVLHHLPGSELRQRVIRQARRLLPVGGQFIHSVWQFQQSPRLLKRVVPWQAIGLDPAQLDPGDALLDWRRAIAGDPPRAGLRYVHQFTRAGLAELAAAGGFEIVTEFDSDGKEGNLGLYQVWKAI